jgi:general stress protein 26
MDLKRRDFLVAAPAAGLVNVLAAGTAKRAVASGRSTDLYQIDNPATIMAAAREIMKEDWVGVLITIDDSGMPRARPVGVGDPTEDGSLWISTRRGSRKTMQIAGNPKAALHFGFDDIPNGSKGGFYASFTGVASVHTDAKTIAAHGPPKEYRSQWPDYPNDLALIRFKPERLEVMGKGIKASERHWQPQGVDLPVTP